MLTPELLNRIVFFTACVGLFIALVLGIAHWTEISLPCGPFGSDCDAVAFDEWSKFLGIPIAFFGAALYLVIAVGTGIRAVRGIPDTSRLGFFLWVFLASGFLISALLLGHSVFRIKAMCIWCLASGVVMSVAFLSQSLGLFFEKFATGKRSSFVSFGILLGLSVFGSLGFAVAEYGIGKKLPKPVEVQIPKEIPLFREHTPLAGNPNAPITVVEFTDLHCPSCSELFFWLENELRGRLKDKVKLYFRHFPQLELHPNSLHAAVLAEWGRSKGRFWETIRTLLEHREETEPNMMISLIGTVGLDSQEAQALFDEPEKMDKVLKNIHTDMDDAAKLGVIATPSWFVIYPDGKTLFAVGGGIQILLSDKEIEKHSINK